MHAYMPVLSWNFFGVMQAGFAPHPDTVRVAATCGLDVHALIDSMLRCKCDTSLPISCGMLQGYTSSLEILQASEHVYYATESAYLAALVSSLGTCFGSCLRDTGWNVCSCVYCGN